MTSSEQARADAMADAETLRLAWQDVRREYTGSAFLAFSLEHVVTAHLWEAWPLGYLPNECADAAQRAARAAFRAVPGLRG